MKNKISRLLSIVLAVIMFFSCCTVAFTASAEEATTSSVYYVDSELGVSVAEGTRPDGVGTKEKPVKTYADATRLIAQDGLTENDTATIVIPPSVYTTWGDFPTELDCQVIITSDKGDSRGILYSSKTNYLASDTMVKNATLYVGFSYQRTNYLMLGGHDLTVEEDAYFRANFVYLLDDEDDLTNNEDQTIISHGIFYTNDILLGSRKNNNNIINGDINIYIDNPKNPIEVLFGAGRTLENKNTYNGDINITIKSADSFNLRTGKNGADIQGSLNIMVDDSVPSPYSLRGNFEALEAAGGKWFIENAATDADFVEFSNEKGVLSVKGGATAYSRQLEKDQVTHTGGKIDLSQASGMYTVSDKEIAPILPENPHKMLYFRTNGGSHLLTSRAKVTPGKTYRFEYSIYTSLYESSSPTIRTDGDKYGLATPKIISEKKIGDYYRVVCEGKIPETYSMSEYCHFCILIPSFAEGILFDRTVYDVDDPEKNNLFEYGCADFKDGLDYVMIDTAYWGVWAMAGDYSYNCGGSGRTKWSNAGQTLEVMDFDESFITYLMKLNDPDDGKWWDDKDLVKEDAFATYGNAKGTFTDHNGNYIKGVKFVLISNDATYTATTDSKGKFNFGKVRTDLYELLIQDGAGKIRTDFNAFISKDAEIEFTVVTDTSGGDTNIDDTIEQDNTDNNQVEEMVASGNLQGTVYTPNLQVVPNLKLVIEGVGEVITDKDGRFAFANIPVGKYELYAVGSDGSKYVFKEYEIKENINLDVKLKYDPPIESITEELDSSWIIWVVVASVVALLVVAALVFFLFIKKKQIR